MRNRIISSFLLIGVIGFVLFLDATTKSDLPCGFAIGIFLMLAGIEFNRLYLKKGVLISMTILLSSVPMLLLAQRYDAHNPEANSCLVLTFLFFAAISFVQLLRKEVKGATANLAFTIFGFVYIILFGSYLYRIRFLEGGLLLLIFSVSTAKISDTGALLLGRWSGKLKLIPWISPNKTMEGFMGGILAGLAFSLFTHELLAKEYFNHMTAIFFGLTIALASVMGDLIESMLKRDSGVKESGNLFPGLGGVLDILDSLLISAPIAYYLFIFSSKINAILS